MKQESVKKLKWVKPCLESLAKPQTTSGACGNGSVPNPADPSCTNGIVAANSCSGGTSVLAL